MLEMYRRVWEDVQQYKSEDDGGHWMSSSRDDTSVAGSLLTSVLVSTPPSWILNRADIDHMNNVAQTSALIAQPYPAVGQIASPYEQQKPVKDLNQYATLKAVAEKANDSFYSNRRQLIEMTNKGILPMEAVDVEPEPSNPYSPPRQLAAKQNGHKHKSPRSHSTHSLCYSSTAVASPGVLRPWNSRDMLGLRQSCGPKQLCIIEKEVHTTRYMPPQPYFVTNSKTEVTV